MAISLQGKINFFLNQLRGGISPQRANQITKQMLGQGLRVDLQSRLTGQYQQIIRGSGIAFMERTSGRVRRADAVDLPFKSDLGYNYMISVKFQVIDPITGSIKFHSTNVGFERLGTKNEMLKAVKERLEFMADNSERYFSIPMASLVDDSLELNSFVHFTG